MYKQDTNEMAADIKKTEGQPASLPIPRSPNAARIAPSPEAIPA